MDEDGEDEEEGLTTGPEVVVELKDTACVRVISICGRAQAGVP